MTILIIYQGDYPEDIRLRKFVETFTKNNYDVVILCRSVNSTKLYENKEKLTIHRLRSKHQILTVAVPHNPLWKKFIKKKILKYQPSQIIVRDLPLASMTIRLGNKLKTPVVVDLAENYPEALKVWRKYDSPLFMLLFRFLNIPKIYERYVVTRSSLIIVVVEEYRDYLLQKYSSQTEIQVISNYPIRTNRIEISIPEKSERIKLFYVGQVQYERGLQDIIKLLPSLKDKAELHIIGDGNYLNELKALSKRLSIRESVFFYGKIKYERIRNIIKGFSIGVIPHLKNPYTDTTVPNKLFEYIGYGKPVLSSNCKPLKRLVNELGCGSVYNNPEELLNILNNLDSNKSYSTFKSNLAKYEKLTWQNEEKKLLKLVS